MIGVFTPLAIILGGLIAVLAAYSYIKLGVYYKDEGASYSFYKKTFPNSPFAASLIGWADAYHSYNVLDVSEFKHYRINHSKLFADKQNHINGIENFWNQAKRHMRRFNGVPRKHFPLFLKECEWRFNNPNPKAQLIQLKQWVKHYMG